MYTEKEIVCIAKRDKNKKRSYLVVNRFQRKHIPVKPCLARKMFSALALELKCIYAGQRLLLIGFAETATAIGAAVATELDCYYIQTTREEIPHVDYLFFSESHSHATEQKIVKDDIDSIILQIDRIIFIEDEVTTGNTIWKIIRLIKNTYMPDIAFSVASLINGMDATAMKQYHGAKISLHYLLKTHNEAYTDFADRFVADGDYYAPMQMTKQTACLDFTASYLDARRLVWSTEYIQACEALWQEFYQSQAEKLSGHNLCFRRSISLKKLKKWERMSDSMRQQEVRLW